MRRNSLTMRSMAVSQLTGTRLPSASRISGDRSRSGWFSALAAVHPLMHSAPLFTGNSAFPTIFGSAAAPSTTIPH